MTQSIAQQVAASDNPYQRAIALFDMRYTTDDKVTFEFTDKSRLTFFITYTMEPV